MRRILTFASLLLAGLMAQTASAELVMFGGQLTPSSLANSASLGTEYRLIFITTGNYEIPSTDAGLASSYQALLEADIAGSDWDSSIYGWKAVVSTTDGNEAVDVINGAAPYSAGAVYNAVGGYVAGSGAAMLASVTGDGELTGSDITIGSLAFDWSGNSVQKAAVWTGSFADGTGADVQSSQADYRLGASGDPQNTLDENYAGLASATNKDWLARGPFPISVGGFGATSARLYGMSQTLTVVPEPSTILLWLGFSGIAGLVYWRKRRS